MRKVGNFIGSITGPGYHAVGIFSFILLPFISFSSTQDPELMPRMALLSVFVAAIAGYYVLRGHEITITKSAKIATGILAVMIAWSGISMIQSINTGDAFTEVIRLAIHGCLFFCLYLIFSENVSDQFNKICRYTMIAVLIFCAIGVYQAVSGWEKHNEVGYSLANTVWSTLSNKNFFSECLLLFLPFILFGFEDEKGYWKVLFVVSIVLDLLFIFILQSAGVWIALIIAGVTWFLISIRTGRFSLRMVVPVVIIFSIFCATIFYIGTKENSVISGKISSVKKYWNNPELINTTSAGNNNSVFERILLWRNAFRMIKDHPVTGVGLNNWRIFNPAYGIGGTQLANTGMMNYEHPHNDYLLILAEEGPVGLIIYLLFIFIVLRSGLKILKKADERTRRIVSLLICGVVAFTVLSLVSYPRSRAYEMLLLMMTSSIILSFSKEERGALYKFKFLGIIILVCGLTGIVVITNRIIAETHARKALFSQLNGNFPRMYSEAGKADTWFYPLDVASTPLSWYKGMAKFYMQDIPAAITEYEKAIRIHPNHLRVLNDLATSYEKSGRPGEAIYYYRRALLISPLFVEGNLNISAAYYNSGKTDSAYYYINRIKNEPMSWREERTYESFLKAIVAKREIENEESKKSN